MQKKSYLISRHYILIIVVAVVATAVGVFYTSNLTLQSDLSVLLPNSFESVKALNRIKEEVGGVGLTYSHSRNLVFPSTITFTASFRCSGTLTPISLLVTLFLMMQLTFMLSAWSQS